MAVPAEENSSHGGQLGAMVKHLRMGDGDMFMTILIPNASSDGSSVPIPDNSPFFFPAKNTAKGVATSRGNPQGSSAPGSPMPILNIFRMNFLGAALGAAFNTLFIESISRPEFPQQQMQ